MTVQSAAIHLSTNGNADVQDITSAVAEVVIQSGYQNGIVTVFCPSSTSGLTTLEYEPGCVSDLRRLFDEITDPKQHYQHNARWGDV